ncbi:FRG domain-containing protein [Acinetobacter baumannii]|uniref:FRG domain-containing protein n=1 Tax=Acinetobacter baumannii TaxID=470 RepID=UPI001CDBDB40|nr:FRG domain-containing protein [Acinetobacter baumannii]MCA4302756.1 FRG domain-containing protein [Acinetobacter baumannii]
MHNKYFDQLENKAGFYELEIDNFDDFIKLLRPDNKEINFLMTNLRLKYEEKELQSNSKLLNGLKVTTSFIPDTKIIFRGQGDNQWDLKPTLSRDNGGKYQFINFMSEQQREHKLLKDFQESCDLAGVYLPADGNELRQKQLSSYDKFFGKVNINQIKNDWFNQDYFELAAFAQHYGVSTRLLDWSKNPFVACYFANSYALDQNYDSNKKISIWVLNYEKLPIELSLALKVLDLPKGINQHISHQQGVLTYTELNSKILISMISDDGQQLEPLSLNKILEIYKCDHRLLKINLSYKHLNKLYRYCNAHNFNACHLFRGAYGAAIHTKDIMKYEKFKCED